MIRDLVARGMFRQPQLLAILAGFAVVSACSPKEEAPAAKEVSAVTERSQPQHTEEEGATRVSLTEAAYETAQIRVDQVRVETGSAPGEGLEVPGQVEFDPRRVALISPRASGRIERLNVVEGDRVRGGQTVALLNSPSYVTAQNDLLQAMNRARLLAGSPDEEGARSLVQAARRRLILVGVGDSELARLEAGGEPGTYLAVTAPFSGRIVEAHALPGSAVEAGSQIFKIADLSVVDVVAEVPERALPLVRIGQQASVRIAAYPGMSFAGRVERLRHELNPETRTVRAVIHVPNPAERLRPGMFAAVHLTVSVRVVASGQELPATDAALLTIAESAVVTEGELRYVFVEVGPRMFERRVVEVASLAPPGSAAPSGDRVIVQRGLVAGERVAIQGAFTLKSEFAKAGLGEHGH